MASEQPRELRPGLWRWSAPHPDWRAGAAPGSSSDWPRDVGCLLLESAGAAVFIDALLDERDTALWRWADERASGRPVPALTTIGFHRRSRDALVARYGASRSRARANLPSGVRALPLPGSGETLFWLERHRALVAGDRIVGADGGRLCMCPESWLRSQPSGITLDGLRELLLPVLELPIEIVLVSHGEPVLAGGRDALAAALSAG